MQKHVKHACINLPLGTANNDTTNMGTECPFIESEEANSQVTRKVKTFH